MRSDVQIRYGSPVVIRNDVVTRSNVELHEQLATSHRLVGSRAHFPKKRHLEMHPRHRTSRKRVVGDRIHSS